jgi:hypothetical protein
MQNYNKINSDSDIDKSVTVTDKWLKMILIHIIYK